MFIVTSYPGTFLFPRTFGDGVWTRLSLIPEPVHVAPDSEKTRSGLNTQWSWRPILSCSKTNSNPRKMRRQGKQRPPKLSSKSASEDPFHFWGKFPTFGPRIHSEKISASLSDVSKMWPSSTSLTKQRWKIHPTSFWPQFWGWGAGSWWWRFSNGFLGGKDSWRFL